MNWTPRSNAFSPGKKEVWERLFWRATWKSISHPRAFFMWRWATEWKTGGKNKNINKQTTSPVILWSKRHCLIWKNTLFSLTSPDLFLSPRHHFSRFQSRWWVSRDPSPGESASLTEFRILLWCLEEFWFPDEWNPKTSGKACQEEPRVRYQHWCAFLKKIILREWKKELAYNVVRMET